MYHHVARIMTMWNECAYKLDQCLFVYNSSIKSNTNSIYLHVLLIAVSMLHPTGFSFGFLFVRYGENGRYFVTVNIIYFYKY